MIAKLSKYKDVAAVSITLSGSKSESNRLLILQALYPNIEIENLSVSDDTIVLQKALSSKEKLLDIHHAGTAMRFLTAYLAVTTQKDVILTGSERMQERPIGILVTALRNLGATITYTNKEEYPPLQIAPSILRSDVTIPANVSSQYISALLLIGPYLKGGLTLRLSGKITSRPYIEMTLALLESIGVSCSFTNQTIVVSPFDSTQKTKVIVEADWSSASYFYSFVALSKSLSVRLASFKTHSLQGDAALISLYEDLGVNTKRVDAHTMVLSKNDRKLPSVFKANLTQTPDIAQTIAVTCFGLGISCHLTGLHTLKIKETDRLSALQTELTKLGAVVYVTEDSIVIESHTTHLEEMSKQVRIATYQDHRMAMAFAPLTSLFSLTIEDPMVVTKSYPDFYLDLKKIGIESVFLDK
ncbi:MAG: 3-phosphoshikimate 1-carboxyvinyltransferase [Patiriisocius sp.]|jgi:3-phosphoshikimate 1-carboxyvinyltransferase